MPQSNAQSRSNDRFNVLSILADTCTGCTYQAVDNDTDRRCVIKVARRDLVDSSESNDGYEHFLDERKRIMESSDSKPGFANGLASWNDDTYYYYAIEMCTLYDFIQLEHSARSFSRFKYTESLRQQELMAAPNAWVRTVAGIFREMCLSAQSAYVISKLPYLDLSLESFLLSDTRSRNDVAHVVLRNLKDSALSFEKRVAYMAPEMHAVPRPGMTVETPQADVYSLGVMLFWMLIGVNPGRVLDPRKSIEECLKRQRCLRLVTSEALDLINHMMCASAKKRITLEDVLDHAFFDQFDDSDDGDDDTDDELKDSHDGDSTTSETCPSTYLAECPSTGSLCFDRSDSPSPPPSRSVTTSPVLKPRPAMQRPRLNNSLSVPVTRINCSMPPLPLGKFSETTPLPKASPMASPSPALEHPDIQYILAKQPILPVQYVVVDPRRTGLPVPPSTFSAISFDMYTPSVYTPELTPVAPHAYARIQLSASPAPYAFGARAQVQPSPSPAPMTYFNRRERIMSSPNYYAQATQNDFSMDCEDGTVDCGYANSSRTAVREQEQQFMSSSRSMSHESFFDMSNNSKSKPSFTNENPNQQPMHWH